MQVGGNMLWNARTGERFVMRGMTYGYTVEDSAEDTWKPALQNIANLNGKTPGVRVRRGALLSGLPSKVYA